MCSRNGVAMSNHAMTGRNIFGQPRPGPSQLSVEQISQRDTFVLTDGFYRSSGFNHAMSVTWNPRSQRIPAISSNKRYIISGRGKERHEAHAPRSAR